jgi:tight adherence protein F
MISVKWPWRRLKRTFLSARGSVYIEAAFILPVVVAVLIASLEYGFRFAWQSKVERINYALASVFRERAMLYSSDETISQPQANQLADLAVVMLGEQYRSQLCLIVESLSFRNKKDAREVAHYQTFSVNGSQCKAANRPLTTFASVSPMTIRGRWLPLYQVTLSVPAPEGMLHKLLKNTQALSTRVTVSNVVLAR